jgi:hypothetical protein
MIVRANLKATIAIAALVVGAGGAAAYYTMAPAAAARNIFNTPDFRQDRALWTNPEYYLNNTAGELRGMALDVPTYEGATGQPASSRIYGTRGTARPPSATPLFQSPFPYTTAKEHYDALVAKANGGTKHTRETIPDWSGRWAGGGGFGGGGGPPSDIVKVLKPEYQESYVQEIKAGSEGRIWGAGSFCLPNGFYGATGFEEIIVTPDRVWTLSSGNGSNSIRWIYTDGSGHTPEALHFPKWHGESVGIWDNDTLIVYTNQIRGWKGGISEFSDELEVVETFRRVGDEIQGTITAYDPVVLNYPIHAETSWELDKETNPALRPLYNTCTDTNGPSPKVHMDKNGLLNEYLAGEGPYQWDVADKRPWVTYFNESDKRYKAYLAAGGDPPGRTAEELENLPTH